MTRLLNHFSVLLFLLMPLSLFSQCPETINIVGGDRLKLTFDPVPDPIPQFITCDGVDYPITQAGNSGNFSTARNTFPEDDLMLEITINYQDNNTSDCIFDAQGDLQLLSLPVELYAYDGALAGEDVRLGWITTMEENNAGFEIEQSFDGTSFTTIGSVIGSGYSETPQSYSFTDKRVRDRAPSGTAYYRLVQLDFDGTKTYFEVIAIDLQLDFERFEITQISGSNSMDRRVKVHFYAPADVRKVNFLLTDISGNYFEKRSVPAEQGVNMVEFDLSSQDYTFYVLSIDNGKEIIGEKIVLTQSY